MVSYIDSQFVVTNVLNYMPVDFDIDPVRNADNLMHFQETERDNGNDIIVNDFLENSDVLGTCGFWVESCRKSGDSLKITPK